MSTRNPAAARSSSDSAPQKPYSRCSRAQSRPSRTTGHALHTERACPSRSTPASGRSPAGAKNNSLRPWQDASAVHARGPLKIKLEMVSTAAKAEPPLWPFEKETPGSRWGATDPPSRPEPILTAGLESVQQLGSMEPINLSDGHTGDQKGQGDGTPAPRHLAGHRRAGLVHRRRRCVVDRPVERVRAGPPARRGARRRPAGSRPAGSDADRVPGRGPGAGAPDPP